MRIIIKGAGDIATGVAIRLKHAGYSVIMLETDRPTTVRRSIAFSQAVFDGCMEVEGISAVLCKEYSQVEHVLLKGNVAVLVDENAESVAALKPDVVIDAIIAKKNIGTCIDDAPIVIGLGPGFYATVDCDAVIETNRGHDLGRTIYVGAAEPDTGVPGEIAGESRRRILRAPCDGVFKGIAAIGDVVEAGDIVATIDGVPMRTSISGMVRGLLHDGIYVKEGMKSGDVDPRGKHLNYKSVSDKARAIGGGVLEAILHFTQEGV